MCDTTIIPCIVSGMTDYSDYFFVIVIGLAMARVYSGCEVSHIVTLSHCHTPGIIEGCVAMCDRYDNV